MQISHVSASIPVSYVKSSSTPAVAPAPTDEVAISISPEKFSSLVGTAANMPEVRTDLVAAYQSQVDSGHYPSSQTLDGLANVLSSNWSKIVGADKDATSSQ